MTGRIFDIKEFSIHDGPGARTTVFFKGCPLRCVWCHNPEGLSYEKQLMVKNNLCEKCGRCYIPCEHEECKPFSRCVHACPKGLISLCGTDVTAEELADRLLKDKNLFESLGGGITFSGGEPLMQGEFLLKLAKKLKGVNLCIETCGFSKPELFKKVIEQMDFVMFDVKLADPSLHKKYTGVENDLILENLRYLKLSGKEHIIRTPLIPDITDTKENLEAIEKLIQGSKWEKLEFNSLAGAKYPMLNMKYKLERNVTNV